jgi:hypothetical protein
MFTAVFVFNLALAQSTVSSILPESIGSTLAAQSDANDLLAQTGANAMAVGAEAMQAAASAASASSDVLPVVQKVILCNQYKSALNETFKTTCGVDVCTEKCIGAIGAAMARSSLDRLFSLCAPSASEAAAILSNLNIIGTEIKANCGPEIKLEVKPEEVAIAMESLGDTIWDELNSFKLHPPVPVPTPTPKPAPLPVPISSGEIPKDNSVIDVPPPNNEASAIDAFFLGIFTICAALAF